MRALAVGLLTTVVPLLAQDTSPVPYPLGSAEGAECRRRVGIQHRTSGRPFGRAI